MSKVTKGTKTPPNGAASGAKGLQITHVILALGTIAIVSTAVVAALILTKPKDAASLPIAPISAGAKVIDETNMEEIMSEVSDKVERGMFMTHMNTTWKFPNGKSASSNAVMGNAESNNYSMWFDVKLKDTDEIVYSSSLLPVGSQIKELVLDTELKKGTYSSIVNIHMVDENNDPVETNMGFSVSLVIEN